MSGMDDLESLLKPANEVTPSRLRSPWCAVADTLGAGAGICLYAVAGIDSVASWPSNRVLLSDPDLSRMAWVLLTPSWLWLILSAGTVSRLTRSWGRFSQWPARPRACFAAAALVSVAVVAGGFLVGAAKGAVRVLPGPRYQVATIDVNQGAWTTVPLSQFHLWQASFVREDGLFMFFGLIAATGFMALLHLRRKALRSFA
jgi:hypothetical protein